MLGLSLPHGLKLGDFVLYSEAGPVRGLGQLRKFVDLPGETRVEVQFPGQYRSLLLSPDAARALEPPMPRADAMSMLRALEASDVRPDERSNEEQYITSVKMLSRGTWHDVAHQLAVLYASPYKPDLRDLRFIQMYEAALFPILAHALEREEGALREQLHTGKAVFSATRTRPAAPPPELPTSPELAGWESLFPFEVSGEVWIGERPDWHDQADNGLAHLHVAAGGWHSYRRHEDDDDAHDELLLVHETQLQAIRAASWRKATELLAVNGGRIVNVVDRVALHDEGTMDRVRYLGGVRVYGGHALCVGTEEWSGPLPVFVSPEDGLPTMVRIPLRDERHEEDE